MWYVPRIVLQELNESFSSNVPFHNYQAVTNEVAKGLRYYSFQLPKSIKKAASSLRQALPSYDYLKDPRY